MNEKDNIKTTVGLDRKISATADKGVCTFIANHNHHVAILGIKKGKGRGEVK